MTIGVKINQEKVDTRELRFGNVLVGIGGSDKTWLASIELAPGVILRLFPKFGMVAMELRNNDNLNLPAAQPAEELLGHLFRVEGKVCFPSDLMDAVFGPGDIFETEEVLSSIRVLQELGKLRAHGWGLRFVAAARDAK